MMRRIALMLLALCLAFSAAGEEALVDGELMACEYALYGGMENEDLSYSVTRGEGWWDVKMTVQDRGDAQTYALPWNALDDLATFVEAYRPREWEGLGERQEHALDAPTQRVTLTYDDGARLEVTNDKALEGGLFGKLRQFLDSYLAEGAETYAMEFSSFDGGGPEYSVNLSAPEVVWVERYSQYDEPHDPMATGSSYTEHVILHGRVPGRTELTVEMYGPLVPFDDDVPETVYVLEVDDEYNVTLVEKYDR